IENGPLVRATVGALRKRKARTTFTWVEGHTQDPGNEAADRLASEGSAKAVPDQIRIKTITKYNLPGAKLTRITQSLAYKLIRKIRMKGDKYQGKLARVATKRNMEYAKAAAAGEDDTGLPSDSKIWSSTKHKDVSRSIRFFLWMMIHDGYKIGRHWTNITGHEEKENCHKCGITESMEHILTKCEVSGQKEIWELASDLWKMKTGEELPVPTKGQVMACAAIKRGKAGTSRLYRILVSESAHLIWKLRNERVIQGKEPASEREIHNRWLKTINNRIAIDSTLTNSQKWGKKAINKSLVLETWSKTLKNEVNLPKDWTWETGVLVGV
ncbi:hypothetical protein C8R47DRAFT_953525, partial [Mycena vitilis]